MNHDHDALPDDVVPKLSLGQRLLTVLPNLRGGSAGTPASNGADTDLTDADPESVVPDEVIDAGGRRTGAPASSQQRREPAQASSARQTGRPNPYLDMSVENLRFNMKYLDDRERRYAMIAGPVIAGLDVLLTFLTLRATNPPVGHKGHYDPTEVLAVGLGSAAVALLVVLCAWFRRRSLTIFALLFAGYGGALTTMIPAWGLAGWLFVRFNRMQKAVQAKTGGRSARGGGVPANPRAAARAGSAAARDRSRMPRDRGRKQPAPAGPPASKRYTPPKPVRPRPPASSA